jgi:amino acid exporter
MIDTLISGVGLGIVLSFVTGPVFFALIKTSIEKGFYAGVSLAAGVVLSDFIYVGLSIYGSSFLQFEEKYRIYIGITGSSVLFAIGLYYLMKKVRIHYENTTSSKHNTAYFFKGFLMCILNPSLLLYWISVTSSIISVTGDLNAREIVPFFGSILVTQFSMDTLKAYYANKLRYRIKESTMDWLNKIAGTLIIIFALKLVYSLLFTNSLI